MAIANPTTVNTTKSTRTTRHFLTCTMDKTTGGDKRLATKHGSCMADTTINILDRSLATRRESCMADANFRILGSGAATGHGSQVTVADLTTVKSAKSTKGTVHYLTCPRYWGIEPTCWTRSGCRYHLDLRTGGTS
ncbi:hypothetical protein E2C01_046700 [Portunus trituberculatus]|uniref:Uncharacterized protein n=1 Tax=Portunus trituberculatus TaxID=210409 RepID=A0A5B7G6E2_PORTR|nr:hypothetical protein [Portunus trituberculatus]